MSDLSPLQPKITRDYAMARIARALGTAGYTVEESDALIGWISEVSGFPGGRRCNGCDGTGQKLPVEVTLSGDEMLDGASEQSAFLLQGICLACRGRGFHP